MALIKEEGPNVAGNKVYTFEHSITLEVPQRYRVGSIIGRGAYGVVCSATDTNSGEDVAIKKVREIFSDAVDTKRVLREVKALQFINHMNVVAMRDLFYAGDSSKFSELYIVTELMETDMGKMLSERRHRFGAGHCQYFTLQLLCALQYVHSAHIIHRDIKPGNLLTDSDCNLKLCDFGLSRGCPYPVQGDRSNISSNTGSAAGRATDATPEMTSYVATRYYRAPELLLVCSAYDYTVDMWGVGCIAAEMVTGRPLLAGRNYIHQLTLIIELLGSPDLDRDLPNATSSESLDYLRSLPQHPRKPLREFHPELYQRFQELSFLDSFEDGTELPSPEESLKSFEDFLLGLLRFRPAARLSAREAIAHPWLEEIRGGQTEMAGCEAASSYSWEYDDKPVTLENLRKLFVREVEEFRRSHDGGS